MTAQPSLFKFKRRVRVHRLTRSEQDARQRATACNIPRVTVYAEERGPDRRWQTLDYVWCWGGHASEVDAAVAKLAAKYDAEPPRSRKKTGQAKAGPGPMPPGKPTVAGGH